MRKFIKNSIKISMKSLVFWLFWACKKRQACIQFVLNTSEIPNRNRKHLDSQKVSGEKKYQWELEYCLVIVPMNLISSMRFVHFDSETHLMTSIPGITLFAAFSFSFITFSPKNNYNFKIFPLKRTLQRWKMEGLFLQRIFRREKIFPNLVEHFGEAIAWCAPIPVQYYPSNR